MYDLSTKALHVELGVGVLELNLINIIMTIKLQLITLYEHFRCVNVRWHFDRNLELVYLDFAVIPLA